MTGVDQPIGCCILLLSLVAPIGLAPAQPRDPAARSKAGSDAMAAGRYDDAVAIFAELAKALPADAGILMNLGMAHSMAGRPRDAIKPLERAVKLQPSLHPAWLFLGTAYLDVGEASRAVRPLLQAVSTDPRSIKARQMLADAYLSLERHQDAGRVLLKLTELDPGSARAWYALGQSHEARARVAFERLRQIAPDSAFESLLVADVLAAEEKDEDAVALYRAALAREPRLRAAGLEAIADVYERSGRSDQAAAERRKIDGLPTPDCARDKAECAFRAGRYAEVIAAVETSKDAEAHYWRARAHNELAVEAFARLEQLPSSPESHAFRAALYRDQDRHLESVAELRKAAQLAPADRTIQRELATSLYLSRDYDAAEPLLAELLKQEPTSVELSFMYGDTLLQAQKVAQAIPLLEAAARGAALTEARTSLARAYLLQGRHADAIPHLKASLESDEDGSLHYQLARAYQATGQGELAKQMLAKYAEIEKRRKAK